MIVTNSIKFKHQFIVIYCLYPLQYNFLFWFDSSFDLILAYSVTWRTKTIREIYLGINFFDKAQFPFAICGKRGHNFDGYLKLTTTNIWKQCMSSYLAVRIKIYEQQSTMLSSVPLIVS